MAVDSDDAFKKKLLESQCLLLDELRSSKIPNSAMVVLAAIAIFMSVYVSTQDVFAKSFAIIATVILGFAFFSFNSHKTTLASQTMFSKKKKENQTSLDLEKYFEQSRSLQRQMFAIALISVGFGILTSMSALFQAKVIDASALTLGVLGGSLCLILSAGCLIWYSLTS